MKPSAHIKPLVDAFCARFGADDEGIVTAVDLAVLVAVADGTIDADERAALAESLEAIMGATVAPTVVRYLVRESRNQIQAAGADARARAIGVLIAERNATDEGLRLALAIAYTSGGLSQTERDAITHVAKAAGASDARLEALIKSAASRAQDPAPPSAA